MATRVLSGGAVRAGLGLALAASGLAVAVDYAPAPALRARIREGERPGVLVAPLALLEELAAAGLVGAPRVALGRVAVGLAVRAGTPAPGIGDAVALAAALGAASLVLVNTASSGDAAAGLFDRLGLSPRLERHPTAAAVLARLAAGAEGEVALAPVTEIRRAPGVSLAGVLPAELGLGTTYAAVPVAGGAAAARVLDWLAGPTARAALAEAGISA